MNEEDEKKIDEEDEKKMNEEDGKKINEEDEKKKKEEEEKKKKEEEKKKKKEEEKKKKEEKEKKKKKKKEKKKKKNEEEEKKINEEDEKKINEEDEKKINEEDEKKMNEEDEKKMNEEDEKKINEGDKKKNEEDEEKKNEEDEKNINEEDNEKMNEGYNKKKLNMNYKRKSFSELLNKNNPKIIGTNIENLLWGFNPNELLNEITFPNEKEEYLIRRIKKIRNLAVKHISISEEEVDFFLECFNNNIYYIIHDFINTPMYKEYKKNINGKYKNSVDIFCKNINIDIDYLRTFDYVYSSLDKMKLMTKTIKKQTISNLDDMFNSNKQLKIFLSRSAAAITIQSFWRMYITRKKFSVIMYGELSYITNTNSTERNPNMLYLPSITDLSVQVNNIKF